MVQWIIKPVPGGIRPLRDQLLPPPTAAPVSPLGASPDIPAFLKDIRDAVRTYYPRMAPDIMQHALYPGDGEPDLLPAGTTTIDLINGVVSKPNGNATLVINSDIAKILQSCEVVADSDVTVQFSPGYGRQFARPGFSVQAPFRQVQQIVIVSDVPYAASASLSTGTQAPSLEAVTRIQDRYSDTIITKAAAAGSPDSMLVVARALSFVPQTNTKTLNQASYGANFIRTSGIGSKIYIVRNLGPSDVELMIFGTVYTSTPGTVLAATSSEGQGWVQDPDVLKSTGGIPLLVQSGQNGALESGVAWRAVQLRARCVAGSAQGATARLLVEYLGIAPLGR